MTKRASSALCLESDVTNHKRYKETLFGLIDIPTDVFRIIVDNIEYPFNTVLRFVSHGITAVSETFKMDRSWYFWSKVSFSQFIKTMDALVGGLVEHVPFIKWYADLYILPMCRQSNLDGCLSFKSPQTKTFAFTDTVASTFMIKIAQVFAKNNMKIHLEWCIDQGVPIDSQIVSASAMTNDLTIFDWLTAEASIDLIDRKTFIRLVQYGHTNVVGSFLDTSDQGLYIAIIIDTAIKYGRKDVLQWLVNREKYRISGEAPFSFPILSAHTIFGCALHNQTDILEWLIETHSDLSLENPSLALINCHGGIINPPTTATCRAIRYNNKRMIELIGKCVDNGWVQTDIIINTRTAMEYASLDLFVWLIEAGYCIWFAHFTPELIEMGRVDILTWAKRTNAELKRMDAPFSLVPGFTTSTTVLYDWRRPNIEMLELLKDLGYSPTETDRYSVGPSRWAKFVGTENVQKVRLEQSSSLLLTAINGRPTKEGIFAVRWLVENGVVLHFGYIVACLQANYHLREKDDEMIEELLKLGCPWDDDWWNKIVSKALHIDKYELADLCDDGSSKFYVSYEHVERIALLARKHGHLALL